VSGLSNAIAVSAGSEHTCAVLSDGTVECGGDNCTGDLGNGGTELDSSTPVLVSGVSNAIAVSAGSEHTCAVVSGGTVECWGDNTYGELGNGTDANSSTPVLVSGLSNAIAVSAGYSHSCADLSGGSVECWGYNGSGELGNGTDTNSLTPVLVRGLGALPAPVFGHTANLQPVSGVVLVRLPKTNKFVPLSAARTVPLGTTIDTTAGKVRLTSAAAAGGHTAAAGAVAPTETGLFYGGVFRVTQTEARSGVRGGKLVALTVLTLAGARPTGCRVMHAGRQTSAESARARSKTKQRSMWGNAHGNFRTTGRYASATVRGTEWLTEDTCAGTLVRVARGVVSVDDFPHHRTVLVRAPHSFLAHPGAGG